MCTYLICYLSVYLCLLINGRSSLLFISKGIFFLSSIETSLQDILQIYYYTQRVYIFFKTDIKKVEERGLKSYIMKMYDTVYSLVGMILKSHVRSNVGITVCLSDLNICFRLYWFAKWM